MTRLSARQVLLLEDLNKGGTWRKTAEQLQVKMPILRRLEALGLVNATFGDISDTGPTRCRQHMMWARTVEGHKALREHYARRMILNAVKRRLLFEYCPCCGQALEP